MKATAPIGLFLSMALALPAGAVSSRSGRSVSRTSRTSVRASASGFVGARGASHFSGGGFSGRHALATTGGSAPAPAPAPSAPGWLANPQPGALIRSAGMGYKIADGGPVHLTVDYSPAGWADVIDHNGTFAQYATGIGVHQGPRDTPPYPGNSGGGAGGNGITTTGPVLGLDGNGQTIVAQPGH